MPIDAPKLFCRFGMLTIEAVECWTPANLGEGRVQGWLWHRDRKGGGWESILSPGYLLPLRAERSTCAWPAFAALKSSSSAWKILPLSTPCTRTMSHETRKRENGGDYKDGGDG